MSPSPAKQVRWDQAAARGARQHPAAGNTSQRGVLLQSQDVGFAALQLLRLEVFPWLDIHILANDAQIHEEDLDKLLAFVSGVLFSEQATNGFGITYDFRFLQHPSVSGLMAIGRWAAEPARKELFMQRCISCRTCVPSGWKFAATKAAMHGFFLVTPPTCRTHLTTDFDDPHATSHIFYPPGDDGATSPTPSRAGGAASPSSTPSRHPPAKCSKESALRKHRPTNDGGCCSCFSFLRCRREPLQQDEGHRVELRRIQELEEANRHLTEMCEKMGKRLDTLEAAVPWVTAVTAAEKFGADPFGLATFAQN